MDKLIFNGKEYELIEISHDRFKIYGKEYEDIGFIDSFGKIEIDIPLFDCRALRIKDKYYGLKLISE